MISTSSSSPPVLDRAQLVRIEALHRGFLFQHLFAVRALLRAPGKLSSVVVETDEDVELRTDDRRIYVQVKHRVGELTQGDIAGAMDRFAALREAHGKGRREGRPNFVVATNGAPNGPLSARMAAPDWPGDVRIVWPGAGSIWDDLPSPMPHDLAGAFEACLEPASRIPLGILRPQTLVWKLAGEVMLAAAGGLGRADHTFRADELPDLFEQMVVQLQDFPAPPQSYRPQHAEPVLVSDVAVRLVTGYSGAGKTAWVAQAALHQTGALAYLDVREMPGPALASGLARELAARTFDGAGELRGVLLPGASGIQLLAGVCRKLADAGRPFTVVLDNVHLQRAEDLQAVVECALGTRFVLLGQPGAAVAELAARLRIAPEALHGWSLDDIAAEAFARGCRADDDACRSLRTLTGGLPLYVQNALGLAAAEGGDVAAFVRSLEEQTHVVETAQEAILSRAVDALPGPARDALAVLSLSDVPLDRGELLQVVAVTGLLDGAAAARALRNIDRSGLSEAFGADRVKIHDAVRLPGLSRLLDLGPGIGRQARSALREALSASLAKRRDLRRFALYLRMLVETDDVKTVVQFATDEFFHEMGVWPLIRTYLEGAARSPDVDAADRFWALDALVFGGIRDGTDASTLDRISEMQGLIDANELGDDERLAVGMKRLNAFACAGDHVGAIRAIQAVSDDLQPSPTVMRIFRYNAAAALFHLGATEAAAREALAVAHEYFDLLGLSPEDVMGRNPNDLARIIPDLGEVIDDVKHLADCLDLYAMSSSRDARDRGMARIHAMKFYSLAHAPDSVVRVGQDLVDDYVSRRDFEGARMLIEGNLLPVLDRVRLAGRTIPLRAQYAVVLAYSGAFAAAEAEMSRLAPYEPGLDLKGQEELRAQRRLIGDLKRLGPPPQAPMPSHYEEMLRRGITPTSNPGGPGRHAHKIGRNQLCPCGSGLKYKRCHG